MVVGIAVIVSLVAFIEWLRSAILDKTNLFSDLKSLIVAVADAFIATTGYIFLFRAYDKRRIHELSAATFIDNAFIGSLTGIILQALFILIIYLAGTFLVLNVNPVSILVSPFAFALTAGFVAEIIIIGVVFRLLEQQTGTVTALLIFIVLFAVLHINAKTPKTDNNEKVKIKKLKISLKCFSRVNFKNGSCIKIEYKFFSETFQVTLIEDKDGKTVPNIKDVNELGAMFTVSLVPTSSVYIEKLWSGDKSDTLIVRGKHYAVEGVGKILDTEYNNKSKSKSNLYLPTE